MKSPQVCFVHIPKTAGTSMREFFESNVNKVCSGAQNIINNRHKLDEFTLLSGHLTLFEYKELLEESSVNWDFVATVREPYSHVVSHLSWVRKAVDEGQETRLKSDPQPFVRIAKKMLEFDLSNAGDLSELICWLEYEKLYFFHDTQSRYLLPNTEGRLITSEESDAAIANMDQFKYIGSTDKIGGFYQKLVDDYSWPPVGHRPKCNVNANNYGLNLDDAAIRAVIAPLVKSDIRFYEAVSARW